MKSYSHLLQWANGSGSDLIAMLHAYKVWSQLHNQKKFGTTDTKENQQKMIRSELEWADKFGIELAALYECQQQIKELEIRLERLKITEPTGVNKVRWSNSEKSIILKVVIAGKIYSFQFAPYLINLDIIVIKVHSIQIYLVAQYLIERILVEKRFDVPVDVILVILFILLAFLVRIFDHYILNPLKKFSLKMA